MEALAACGLTTGEAPFRLYIQQPYELYSDENHAAWRKLYARLKPRWDRYAIRQFQDGLGCLGLPKAASPASRT